MDSLASKYYLTKLSIKRAPSKFLQWLSQHLPAELVYYCAIRVWGYATSGKYPNVVASEITAAEAIEKWAKDHEVW